MHYRPEIDGLRTIAVVPVILFHAGFTVFSGGYVGVDVFFVISGYLITSILLAELEAGNFSIARFYERRARRILPALFVVLLVTSIFAALWMPPSFFKDFSKSVVAVVVFASNFLFWKQAGYFDAAADFKPLLHTWSLAVEEQYYVVFPLFLAAVWRFGRNRVFLAILVLALLSLGLSQWASHHMPSANFYLAPTRAWELLAGSLCAFLTVARRARSNNALALLGLALIVVPIFWFDDTTPFPGLYAMAPVGGAGLIIMFAAKGTWVARLLSTRPFVGIGLISYSAYLWHQPMFALARIRSLTPPSMWTMAGLSLAAVALAYLTWALIEQPARQRRVPLLRSRAAIFTASVCCGLAFIGLGLLGYVTKGLPQRFPGEAVAQIEAARDDIGVYRVPCITGQLEGGIGDTTCILGKAGRDSLDFVLLGDSFAAALADGMNVAAQNLGLRGAIYSMHACPPLLGVGGWWPDTQAVCDRMQDGMVAEITAAAPQVVFLHASWSTMDGICQMSRADCAAGQDITAYLQSKLAEVITAFTVAGIKVVVLGHPPSPAANLSGREIDPALAAFRAVEFDNVNDLSLPEAVLYGSVLDRAFAGKTNLLGASYFDLRAPFCQGGDCVYVRNGVPLFFDHSHITATQSLAMVPLFENALAQSFDIR